MSTRSCTYCRRSETGRLRLITMGNYAICRDCNKDGIDGHPGGYTVARRSPAAKVTCPHCGAKPGELCKGPGVVRFIHARRRDAVRG